ncbi:SSI family serine proteinase inhibitor [Blastococcus mobilis]|uniref:Subtilisin inhibitor-like n=1 Tax=Blastococcus mobilis TaxID=1938746 RepID=A0A238Z6S7_9ACTN|nr:SSI family serine proteinase inhibitor [Blastococcus mobilis]SNR78504.1 Subtilisin inhibitor-like [Blastococcus mobilis]
MRRLLALPLLASLAVLAACASPSDDDGAGSSGGPGDPAVGQGVSRAGDDLQVVVDRGDGSAPEQWTLTCAGNASGTHPEAEAACAHLAGLADPFAPLPDDVVCTQQYGGPETAHVTGRWNGEPVDLRLARTDGCLITQWDSLVPFVPPPIGVDPIG